jgi:hypothetical protein
MTMRRTAILAVLVACGGGPGATTRTFTDSTEPAGGGRDSPGTTRDPASGPEATPPGRDAPPPSQDPPPGGGGSSGSSGTPTECFACQDVNYSCTGTVQGQQVKDIGVHVQSKDGKCVTEADQQVTYVFACNRKITTVDGVAVGTWSTTADGITVTLPGIQLTCVPQRVTPGGGTSSGNNADAG